MGIFGQVAWWFVLHEPYSITFVTRDRSRRASVLSAFYYRGRTNASRPAIGFVVNACRCLIEVELQSELSGNSGQRFRRRHRSQPRFRQAFRYLIAFQDKLNNPQ